MRIFDPTDQPTYQEILTQLPYITCLNQVYSISIFKKDQEKVTYNAFEKDVAVVNIYFGKPTSIGKLL
jgi:hypothetical protein